MTWSEIVEAYDKDWDTNMDAADGKWHPELDPYDDNWRMLVEIPKLSAVELAKANRDNGRGDFSSGVCQMWGDNILDEVEKRLTRSIKE